MKRIILSLAAAALALPALQAQEEGTQYLKLKKDGQTLYAVPVEQVREMTFPNTYDYWGTQGKSLWQELVAHGEWSTFARMVRIAGYELALDLPCGGSKEPLALFVPDNVALSYVTDEDLLDTAAVGTQVRNYLAEALAEHDKPYALNEEGITLSGACPAEDLPAGAADWDGRIDCHNGFIVPLRADLPYPLQAHERFAGFEAQYFYRDLLAAYVPDAPRQGGMLNLSGVGRAAADYNPVLSRLEGQTVLVPATEALRDAAKARFADLLYYDPALLAQLEDDGEEGRLVRADYFGWATFDEGYASQESMPGQVTLAASGRTVSRDGLDLGEPVACAGRYFYPVRTEVMTTEDLLAASETRVEGENPYRRLRTTAAGLSVSSAPLAVDTLSYTRIGEGLDINNVEYYQPRTVEGREEKYAVSGGEYLKVESALTSAGVIMGVGNTLKTTYDVWLTFVPAAMVEGVTQPKPADMMVTTQYSTVRNGTIAFWNVRTGTFPVDPYAVTKVKVATIDLGTAFYGLLGSGEPLYEDWEDITGTDLMNRRYGVKLIIQNRSTNAEEQDRNLYLDCIELVPVAAE